MAPAPLMLFGAKLAIIVAKACAQALATRDRAPFVCLNVRRRPDSILVENIKDVAIGAMVQFLRRGLFTMLVGEILSILLVARRESVIPDLLDSNNCWIAIVKWSRSHEFGDNLITLRTIQRDAFQTESCPGCWTLLVLAPTRCRKSQVATTTVPCNSLGALLGWPTMIIIHTEPDSLVDWLRLLKVRQWCGSS